MSDKNLVYYIRFGNRIKIGTTANLVSRLNGLPYEEVLATEPGGLPLERERHKQFRDDRIIGEWFRISTALMAHISTLGRATGAEIPVSTGGCLTHVCVNCGGTWFQLTGEESREEEEKIFRSVLKQISDPMDDEEFNMLWNRFPKLSDMSNPENNREIVVAWKHFYRADEDFFEALVSECFCQVPREFGRVGSSSHELYLRAKDWMMVNGHGTMSQRAFTNRLKDRGFEYSHGGRWRGFPGLQIRTGHGAEEAVDIKQ